MPTMKEVCETIVEAGILDDGKGGPTAREIFEYSPTGELVAILGWYFASLAELGRESEIPSEYRDDI